MRPAQHPTFSPHADDHGYDQVEESGFVETGHASHRMEVA